MNMRVACLQYTHLWPIVFCFNIAGCSLVNICFNEWGLLQLYECGRNWVCVFGFILWIMFYLKYFVNDWCNLWSKFGRCDGGWISLSEIQLSEFWRITICWGDTVVSRSPSSDMVCGCECYATKSLQVVRSAHSPWTCDWHVYCKCNLNKSH